MNLKLFLTVVLLVLVTGCSSFSPKPPPTPRAAQKPQVKPQVQNNTQPAAPAPKKITPGPATYAIDSNRGSFKEEATVPTITAEPINLNNSVPSVNNATPAYPGSFNSANPGAIIPPATVNQAATPTPVPQTGLATAQAPTAAAVAPVLTPAPAPIQVALEDASLPAGSSPAVVALLSEAERNRNQGDLDSAVISLERALRIDARNPTLTYKLALIRLKQSKPQLAEELAGKAALLAGNNLDLKRKSWLLIAQARQLQQNNQGAKEAKAKAASFFGH